MTMASSREFAEAEMWIDQHATVTRENWANGDIRVVVRSRKHPTLSCEGRITPPEEPNDYPELVIGLVADLKGKGG